MRGLSPKLAVLTNALRPIAQTMSEARVETLREGDGKTFPEEGDICVVHYVGRLAATKEVFDAKEGDRTFSFPIGGQVRRA
jgi:FKBP-type peptidyl-prolyl cis-trans isomerase